MSKLILERKSTDGTGTTIWHYEGARRVVRAPDDCAGSGYKYRAEWLPYAGIYFHRIQPALSLADARRWLRQSYIPGRVAHTAAGRTFTVPAGGI